MAPDAIACSTASAATPNAVWHQAVPCPLEPLPASFRPEQEHHSEQLGVLPSVVDVGAAMSLYLGHRVLVRHLVEPSEERVELVLGQRPQQVLLVVDMGVERRRRDPELGGDPPKRERFEAIVHDQAPRRRHDRGRGGAGVGRGWAPRNCTGRLDGSEEVNTVHPRRFVATVRP